MKTCKKCGNQFDGKFCNQCGEEFIQSSCLKCGSIVDGKFCSVCGTELNITVFVEEEKEKHLKDKSVLIGISKTIEVKDNTIIITPISNFGHLKEAPLYPTNIERIFFLPSQKGLFSSVPGHIKFYTNLKSEPIYQISTNKENDPYAIEFSDSKNMEFYDLAKNISNELSVRIDVMSKFDTLSTPIYSTKSSTPTLSNSSRKSELDSQGLAYCPKCLSTSLSSNKKGFGIGKAVVGAALTGGIGLMAGNIGAKKVRITCLKCGHQFWAGK